MGEYKRGSRRRQGRVVLAERSYNYRTISPEDTEEFEVESEEELSANEVEDVGEVRRSEDTFSASPQINLTISANVEFGEFEEDETIGKIEQFIQEIQGKDLEVDGINVNL